MLRRWSPKDISPQSQRGESTGKEVLMRVERIGERSYKINDNPVTDLSSISGAVKALKKPIPITACKINEPFTVETTEGIMNGDKGDWLIQGVLGEMYICPADVFEKTYDILS